MKFHVYYLDMHPKTMVAMKNPKHFVFMLKWRHIFMSQNIEIWRNFNQILIQTAIAPIILLALASNYTLRKSSSNPHFPFQNLVIISEIPWVMAFSFFNFVANRPFRRSTQPLYVYIFNYLKNTLSKKPWFFAIKSTFRCKNHVTNGKIISQM